VSRFVGAAPIHNTRKRIIIEESTNVNIRQLVEDHPEIQRDRFDLSFGPGASADVARALSHHGVVMLRGALSERTLERCRRTFERFAQSLGKRRLPDWAWGERDEGPDPEWAEGEAETGSWHKPWTVRHWNRRPAATVISAMVESWAWPVMEEICGTTDIAVLLGLCLARHAIDVDLGVGAHQDAKGLPPIVPFSAWVPMHDVVPGFKSGLGFVVRPPDTVLPTLPHGDIGPDYVLENIDRVWVPTYRAGDLTIHTNRIPHFTTGYGTRSDRYSLEVRAMAREAAPWRFHNPCVYVGRPDGVPLITGAHCDLPVRANGFVASFR
jgi:hypothetical protein